MPFACHQIPTNFILYLEMVIVCELPFILDHLLVQKKKICINISGVITAAAITSTK